MSGQQSYTLTLTENQINGLIHITDLYQRLGMGQFQELLQHFIFGHLKMPEAQKENFPAIRDDLEQQLNLLKRQITGTPDNGFHSIRSPEVSETAKIAADLHSVLRKHDADSRGIRLRCGVLSRCKSPKNPYRS